MFTIWVKPSAPLMWIRLIVSNKAKARACPSGRKAIRARFICILAHQRTAIFNSLWSRPQPSKPSLPGTRGLWRSPTFMTISYFVQLYVHYYMCHLHLLLMVYRFSYNNKVYIRTHSITPFGFYKGRQRETHVPFIFLVVFLICAPCF